MVTIWYGRAHILQKHFSWFEIWNMPSVITMPKVSWGAWIPRIVLSLIGLVVVVFTLNTIEVHRSVVLLCTRSKGSTFQGYMAMRSRHFGGPTWIQTKWQPRLNVQPYNPFNIRKDIFIWGSIIRLQIHCGPNCASFHWCLIG